MFRSYPFQSLLVIKFLLWQWWKYRARNKGCSPVPDRPNQLVTTQNLFCTVKLTNRFVAYTRKVLFTNLVDIINDRYHEKLLANHKFSGYYLRSIPFKAAWLSQILFFPCVSQQRLWLLSMLFKVLCKDIIFLTCASRPTYQKIKSMKV